MTEMEAQREVGELLCGIAASRGMTIAALARAGRFPYERLYRVLRGYRRAHPGELEKIAAAIGVTLDAGKSKTTEAPAS